MVMINKKEVGSKSSSMNKIGSKNSEYRGTASGVAAKKTASKTVATPGTKVSQATIDKIKKMGMSAALKGAPKANAEMTEALRRMYGQKRLDAATKVSKPGRAVMTQRPSSGVGMAKPKSSAPGAISNKSKSNAPSAISGKKVSTSSTTSKATTTKKSTNQNLKPGSIAYNIANNKGIFGNKK